MIDLFAVDDLQCIEHLGDIGLAPMGGEFVHDLRIDVQPRRLVVPRDHRHAIEHVFGRMHRCVEKPPMHGEISVTVA